MAAVGTTTHVLEVAARLAEVASAHAESIQRAASAAVPPSVPAAEATAPPPAAH